ncbi:BrnA antitoxin family protein [Nostocales cyanobacterium LEGE 11386]|nr:BrnA antitoxin family protein [Nostocales cyanobacterium LEGE 11386]
METEYDFSQGKRGAIEPTPSGKTRITIRLDDEILAWFRDQVHLAGGGNYQTLINNVLREYIQQHREPLEDTLRRILREELERMGK